MIATLVGPSFHAGFRAAAHLHDLDGFRRPPLIEVVGGPSCRRIRGLDVVQHWIEPLAPEDLVVIDGISCTGLARSVVDVCGLGDADLALRAVDDFERRRVSLNWLRLTTERLHRPGQSGTRVCRDLLDRRQQGGRVPDSWFERLIERCLSWTDLPPWSGQHEVRDDVGAVAGRIDLACPALLLGVEAHSREFHFGSRPEALDEQRDNRLGALGWHLVYLGWYATESPTTVAATIRAIALRRATQLGVTLPWGCLNRSTKSRRNGPK